jgi:porin
VGHGNLLEKIMNQPNYNPLMKNKTAVFLCAAALAAVVSARSEDAPSTAAPEQKSRLERFAEQDYLLGDWDGWRTKLSKRGVDFEFFYAASVPSNLAGGIQTGSRYQGALLMTLDLDSDKLVGYHGGTFHVGSLWLNGAKPFSDDYVGDLNKVNLIDFPNSFRLWELWYQQKFANDKLSFKLGDMVVDHDFIVPEYYNSLGSINFLNQTFFYPTMAFNLYDIPGFPKKNHGLPSTPFAAPGVLLRWDVTPKLYAQAAVYSGNPDQTSSGTRFNMSEEEGALSYYEVGYLPNHGTNDTGLGGSYKLGAWLHTGDFNDVRDGVVNAVVLAGGGPGFPIRNRHLNYGGYFLGEQQLYREVGKDDPAQQGLVSFFRASAAPSDRNLAEYGFDGGVVYKGLLPHRDWDTLGLAASYLRMSEGIRRGQHLANLVSEGAGGPEVFSKLADYEGVVELSYKAQVTAWWTIQPSVQRVFHPGGRLTASIPDSWVFIVQTTLRF